MIIEYTNKIMGSRTININDIFFGSEQSKYAGIALFMTIIILCMIVLFSNSRIPIGDRFVFVLFILIISIPSILMSLFELTCIVTGGNMNTRWWCWLLAWVLSVIIIVYCVMIIISMLISMSEYDMANDRLDYSIEKNKMNKDDADMYAKQLISEDKKLQESNKNNQKPIVYQTPLSNNTHHPTPDTHHPTPDTHHPTPDTHHPTPNTHHPTPDTHHPTPNTHHHVQPSVNTSSLNGIQSQPPHYQEPKVTDLNNMPYPKMSSDIGGNDDIYMNYSSLTDNTMTPHQNKHVPQKPLVSNMSSSDNTHSFNGYDNNDNYSSY
jgi:hypothetical protein